MQLWSQPLPLIGAGLRKRRRKILSLGARTGRKEDLLRLAIAELSRALRFECFPVPSSVLEGAKSHVERDQYFGALGSVRE